MRNRAYDITHNNGYKAQVNIARDKHCKLLGKANEPDLIIKGKAVETKFFTIKPATVKRNAVMNSAHGFTADKTKTVVEQLKDYCERYCQGGLIVGFGADADNGTYEKVAKNPREAFEYFLPRIQYHKGTRQVNFTFKPYTSKSGGHNRRLQTFIDNGFIIG